MAPKRKDSDGNVIGGRKPREEKPKTTAEREFKGWVNVNLTDGQKSEFDAWYPHQDFASMLDRLCNSAYRVSVYWDDYNETYSASITCWQSNHDQCGYALSMRGSTALTALWRVLFTHYHVCHEEWGAWMTRGKKTDW